MKQSMAVPICEPSNRPGQNNGALYGRIFALTLVLVFTPFGISMAGEPDSVANVGVYARHIGSKIVYFYRVTNHSQMDITAVTIGYDTRNDEDPGNDMWELSELPSGWNPRFGIPAASSNSPTGWRVSKTTPVEGSNAAPGVTNKVTPGAEGNTTPGLESKTHAITWEIINDKSPVLASGRTMAKMSIALDKADASYLTAHALVAFSDGPPPATVAREPVVTASKGGSVTASKGASVTAAKGIPAVAANESPSATIKSPPMYITVPVEILDTHPPTLAVALTPNTIWSPENKYIPVIASFPTKEDDFDNLPEIKLESITANEPLEPDDIRDASYDLDDRYLRLRAKCNGSTDRVYTVIYSATDASGNQATASATVTVSATAPVATPATVPAAIPAAASAVAPVIAPHDQGKNGKAGAH